MKTITRQQAIDDLRAKLLALSNSDHSICDVAARLGIFCGGFAQWTFNELKKRHPTIVRSRPHITPQELRDLANRWQLARQFAKGTELACDTQLDEGALRVCRGWDEWSNEDLERYYLELCGEEVKIA